jgi:chromatin remodeling complex protein RSC6
MAAKKKGKKAAKKGAKKAAKKPAKKAAKKSGRKPNAAFMKPVMPNDKLAAIVGASPMPRTELTKKLWVYIKKNNLQDKKNRRMINADDKMRALFGGKSSASMFELTKYASKNLK